MRRLKAEQVEAVSVCLLFSFLNPVHEQRVAAIVREEFPEAFLSVSSEVIPQYREYERFSTVGLNAYVGPKVSSYIGRFDAALRAMNVKSGIHLMTSAAGVATPEGAMVKPVNLLMSGPIAGVVGGIWTGRQSGENNVITLDVGGTSADIGLAQDGKLRMKHLLDTKVGPYQAMIPMVDVDTIGAGGGSIAYIDAGGIFRVGPRSAGADPGPVAYGRGGTEPTATDAMVVLGWLRPELFLGGKMGLREDLAREAIDTHLASKLGTSIEDAAMGVYRILVHSMVDAIEQASVRKGFDPREFVLVAEGGGGPLFAPEIAPEVGVKNVLVPSYPGITAALGLLTTDMVYEYVATSYAMASALYTDAAACATLEEQFAKLAGRGARAVRGRRHRPQPGPAREHRRGPLRGPGLRAAHRRRHGLDRRGLDRRHEGGVPRHPRARVLAPLRGRRRADRQRARARRRHHARPRGAAGRRRASATPPEGALKLTADAWFRDEGKLKKVETAFYERTELVAGNVVEGPAIITQFDSTSVVPPGFTCKVDRVGNLVITYSEAVQQAAERGH